MITAKTLRLSVKSLKEFAKKRLPDQELIALDARDECPLEIVHHMCSPDKLGIQLLFFTAPAKCSDKINSRKQL